MLACAAVPIAKDEGRTGSVPVSVDGFKRSVGLARETPKRRERLLRLDRNTHDAPSLSARRSAR